MQSQIRNSRGNLTKISEIVATLELKHSKEVDDLNKELSKKELEVMETKKDMEVTKKDMEVFEAKKDLERTKLELSTTVNAKDLELAVSKLTSDLKAVNGNYMRVTGYLGSRGLLGKGQVCSIRMISHLTPGLILDKMRTGSSDL